MKTTLHSPTRGDRNRGGMIIECTHRDRIVRVEYGKDA